MRVLNWSSRVGCLQCSFNDKDLNEYVQLKKRRSVLQKKSAVQKIGRQFNNTWILGEDFCITSHSQHRSKIFALVSLLYSLESRAPNKLSAHSRAVVLPVPLTPKAKGMGQYRSCSINS